MRRQSSRKKTCKHDWHPVGIATLQSVVIYAPGDIFYYECRKCGERTPASGGFLKEGS